MNSQYDKWIYCPTCAIKILVGVDTEFNYAVIDNMAKVSEKNDVPIAWGHIFDGVNLNHVKTVTKNKNGSISYEKNEHPIQKIQKHIFSIGKKKIFWTLENKNRLHI